MRAAGVRVGIGDVITAHRALAAVDPVSREDAYFALRTALCSRHADLEVFDAAFAAAFGERPGPEPPPSLGEIAGLALPRFGVPDPGERDPLVLDAEVVPAAWSSLETLRQKDFSEYTDAERALARRLMARLAARGPQRRSRRTHAARRRGAPPAGGRHDLRRTVRASLRYAGEPLERHWHEPRTRARPVVLVCDVSGSMETYSRMLLQYMHAWVSTRGRVEAFVFGTRLTRVTRELGVRDHDAAVARVAETVVDWSGGTRIGDALAALNREHGRRLGRGSLVIVLSDGWDRGDPELLEREVARLARCAHSLIWLNPLKAQPGYEPLTRGIQAALPHVDRFLAGNSIASLEELAETLEGGMA
jgi:uncharacterized protein with von Willebrand factor type A (vWA) domain